MPCAVKKGVYLLAILLLPSVIYVVFSLGQHNVSKLPFLGPFTVIDGDTVYEAIPIAINKPTVLYAPRELNETTLSTLVNFGSKLEWRSKWQVVIANTDSAALAHAKQTLVVETENWSYLRLQQEDTEVLHRFWGEETSAEMVHLVDAKGHLRGSFDPRLHADNLLLSDGVKLLLQEPHIQWKNDQKTADVE